MDLPALITRLESFPSVLVPAIAEWNAEEARWRPEPGDWSVNEIVSHLVYAEVEDFRPRLRRTLEDPGAPWDTIDPEGVVGERGFQENDAQEQAQAFARERADSMRWLRALGHGAGDPVWGQAHEHPTMGTLRAGDLLAAWCAHDALHLRQLAQRRAQITERDVAPYRSRYAGVWPAEASAAPDEE